MTNPRKSALINLCGISWNMFGDYRQERVSVCNRFDGIGGQKMKARRMTEADIQKIVPFFINYYNTHEEGEWTPEPTYKRIHQVWSREDSFCVVWEDGEELVGFAMGYFEQYYDLFAYDLVEIIIGKEYQGKGIGTQCLLELENMVKAEGAAMVKLEAVNDEMHEHFYSKLKYKNVENFVLKSKWL